MSTNYSSIFSLFLASIKDYSIDKIYTVAIPQGDTDTHTDKLEKYLIPFLTKAIPNFINCQYDLEDRDDTTRQFTANLGTDEKVILSNLMLIEWLTKEINDITQMSLHLQDNDMKFYSEAQNLKGKREHLVQTTEEVDKQINRYGFKILDWTTL